MIAAQAVVKVKKIIIGIVLNKFYFKFNFLYHLFPLFKLSIGFAISIETPPVD
jgi:hypothetical protein